VAYVRKTKVKGHTYYQLVRGYREDGKVKIEVLAHLGKNETPEKAIEDWEARAVFWRQESFDHLHAAKYIEKHRLSIFVDSRGTRRKRLVPREGVPLDEEPVYGGMFAPHGWFYSSGTPAEERAESQEYHRQAEEYEARIMKLRSITGVWR
jgi:hypothetical protein